MRTKPLRLDDQPQPGLQRLVDEPPNPLRQPAIAIKPHATIVDAPASRSDAPVPASSSRLLMSEFVTSSLSPGIAAQIAAGGGRGSAAGAMLGNAQWTEDGSVSQAFPPGKDGRPLEVGGQLTAAALAAAEVAASAPVAPAAPKADPTEIAALELLLAEPANREMVEHFGGQLEPLPTWTSVGQGIEARYGPDLASRLNQLQHAQRKVEGEFFQAMDQAQQHPPTNPAPPPPRRGEATPTTDRPGWRYEAGQGHWDGDGPSWTFDPGAFARHYAQGDSPAQRAFAHLHGPDAMQFVPAPNTEAGGQDSWQLSGLTVRQGRPLDREEGLTPEAFHARNGWVQSGALRPDHHLDPNRITKLNNKEFVWFDPVHGFSTDSKNLRGSWIDRAFPQLMGVAFGVMGAAAAGKLVASAGAVAQSAAMGAAGSALNQFVSTGRVSFKQVLSSALAGGLTAGVARIPGLSEHLNGAQTAAGRLMQATGRATIQGAIQAVVGGDFKGGFINSLMASAAGEISAHIDAQISQMPGLSAAERSSLRLLGNATGSALRAVANPGDPLAGLAGDFLGQVMGDVVQQELNRAPAADPLGSFIGANQERWDSAGAASPSFDAATVTVAQGDTLERIARQHYGDNWRAGMTLMAADNGLSANQWGSPLIRAGQTLHAPSLAGFDAHQLNQLGRMGGDIVANNARGLNARAQLEALRAQQEAARLAAARQPAPQNDPRVMSRDEAYARYMAAGGRSASFAREMGEAYQPIWHVGGQADASAPTVTRWHQGRPVATISPLPDDALTGFFTSNPVGRAWRGAGDHVLGIVPNALGSAADLIGDAWNYFNPMPDSVLSQQPPPFMPRSPLLQDWEQHGLAGTTGGLITGAVRGLPGINLVDELGRPSRNWEAVGGAVVGSVGRSPVGAAVAGDVRIFNGVPMHPKVPEPAAGWSYTPAAINSSRPNLANAHINGYVGEIAQVNRIAATMPNEVIVLWGNRVTQNGSDVVTVNRLTGEVTLWDNKFRSANRSIGSSATFQPGSRSFLNARAQAERAILNSNLSAHLRAQALRNLLEGNVRTITSGSGHALNSVFVQPPAK